MTSWWSLDIFAFVLFASYNQKPGNLPPTTQYQAIWYNPIQWASWESGIRLIIFDTSALFGWCIYQLYILKTRVELCLIKREYGYRLIREHRWKRGLSEFVPSICDIYLCMYIEDCIHPRRFVLLLNIPRSILRNTQSLTFYILG